MTARKLDKSQWRTFSTVSRKRSKESRPRSRLPRYPLAIRSRRSGCSCTALLTIRMTTLSRSRSRGLIT